MAGQATELFNLASSFDPLSAYRQGQMTSQKYDIEQAILDEQTKEIQADKQESTLAQQAQAPGAVPLQKMANQMIPDAKLYNDDGTLTTAGQMNDMLINANKLAKQSKMLGMQASLIQDPYQRTQATAEARRLGQAAQADMLKVRDLNNKVKDDSIYAAATATNQTQWDAALQAYQDSGLPLPKGIPTQYTPENAKKIAALAPAALQSKINNDLIKRDQEERKARAEVLKLNAEAAKARDGVLGGKDFKDVRGQLQGLRNWLPDSQIKNLGPKEVPAVSTRLEAAELTDELAQMTKNNPKATGLVSSFFQNFERFIPSRYDDENSAESISQKINSEIDKWEGSKKFTKDEISEARLIAKKAVDVINARALAASGGNRILVSELRLQKDVLGLDKLTPKSAPYVYSELAESDRKALKRFGIDTSTIKRNFEPIKREETTTTPTQNTAPAPAIEYLKANPTAANKNFFKAKYKYLPEGL